MGRLIDKIFENNYIYMRKFLLTFGFLLFSAVVFLIGFDVCQAAEFYITPPTKTFRMECEYSVNIMIDTEGVDTNAADAVIEFNPNEVEIIDQVGNMPGTQIKPGTVYQMYPGNTINETEQRIYLTGFNVMGAYNGTGVFGSIVFRSKPGITSTDFNFYYVPGGSTDSNIADMMSNDILDGVAGASYTFEPGPCVDDTTPPWVQNPDPSPGEQGVPLDSNVSFSLRDDISGVDLDSVRVTIDGIDYTLAGPNAFTYTGDPLNYRITVDPIQDFLPDTPVQVEIRAQDLSNNIMNPYIYSFNEPIPDVTPPYVQNPDPSPGERDVPLNANVAFNILDEESGVDINSVVVEVDGITYQLSGPNTFTYTGDKSNFRVTIDPIQDFPDGTGVQVEINAQDEAGNTMPPYRYRFNEPIPDNTPPWVQNPDPQPNQRDVPLDANVSFEILDDISGVDIDSVSISIDGIVYTLAGENTFTVSGEPLHYFIMVDPIQNFPEEEAVIVEINGRDLRGNVMSPFRYRFNEPVPPPPTCEELGCTCESMDCFAECPPCELEAPEVTVPEEIRVGEENVSFWTGKHTIELTPAENGYISILPSSVYSVELNADSLANPAKGVQWLVGSSVYRMAKTQDASLYKVSAQSDFAPGNYPARLVITYLDDSVDVLNFGITVVPWGYVYEEIDNQEFSVPGASITLINGETGAVWPGEAFGQTNPVYSTSNGYFGFMTLPGDYNIRITKPGYRSREIPYYSSLIINPAIELIKEPEKMPPVSQVPEFIGAAGERVVYQTKVIRETLDQPKVQEFQRDVLNPAVYAATAANLLNALFALRGLIFLLFTQPMLLFGRRRKGGVVYDSQTKKPIPYAVAHLIDVRSNEIVDTTVTGRDGQYNFTVNQGVYRLEVKKPRYKYPSIKMADVKVDPVYQRVYHGENIVIEKPNQIITKNIPMDAEFPVEVPKKIAWIKFGRIMQKALAAGSVLLALTCLIISPSWLYAFLLLLHILIYIIFWQISKRRAKVKQV